MKTFKGELKEDCKGAPDVGGLHRLSAHAKTFKVSEQIGDFNIYARTRETLKGQQTIDRLSRAHAHTKTAKVNRHT